MNEWIKKIAAQIKNLWGKWTLVQRAILIGVAAALIAGLVALFSVSSAPTMVPVIDAPIRDEAALDRIIVRLNEEGVKTQVSAAGIVQVPDEKTARRMRAILIREDLIPRGTDPWAIFDRERWTITDFERNVDFQRAFRQMVTDHIKAIDEVDDANVSIVMPERTLFSSEQNPVTASVIITPRPGSDITENRYKIEGIQKLLKYAIEGLTDDNIVITDQAGNILNNFTDMAALDRLKLVEREQKIVRQQEAQYRAIVLTALQAIYTADRVRDLNLKITMDMSKKAVNTEEHFPITIREDNPDTPYDDSELTQSITRSRSTSNTTWRGSGFNPEGPTGVEPNVPPSFRDMSNLWGEMSQETETHNEEINKRVTQEERSPQIDRITVSVNIDGKWKPKYDEKGKPVTLPDGTIEREYIPVPPEDILSTERLIQAAVSYNAGRGDSVSVQNIPFDRTKEFADADAAYFRRRQVQTTVLIFLSGLVVLLISFIIFRMITRAVERRRRLEAEERARREAAIREGAIANAEEEGVEVSMSVEDRARMELLESVANMAKEQPENVAQLIRTWILEE
jgi:flagellar M-ring protein FliF